MVRPEAEYRVIQAVILDLGNVIVPVDFSPCFAELTALCGQPREEISRRIAGSGLAPRFELGELSPKEFYREVCRVLDLEINFSEFCRIWNSIFPRETLLPESLLEGLHHRYPLLLLSNTNPLHFSLIRETYPILRFFGSYVLSFRVGAAKPSPHIYREAIARAGCPPEQCFFADDVISYVEAAKREGMDAVQFQSVEQLKEDFRARGIQWE